MEYRQQLEQLEKLERQLGENRQLDAVGKARKKQITETLRGFEEWFALQLFPEGGQAAQATPYELAVRNWLAQHGQDAARAQLNKQRRLFHGVKLFSSLAAAFMLLGTSYLLVEAFTVIPFMAVLPLVAWPVLIVALSIVAGIAYGLITYNAITDMISNKTLSKWYQKLHDRFHNDGFTFKNVALVILSIVLVTLAIGLTICTAGTWWTIAQKATPLFTWMGKIPSFVMGVINPIITGLSAVVFNVQNSSESMELIEEAVDKRGNIFSRAFHAIQDGWTNLKNNENGWQIINPFRILLKLTLLPLRMVLFAGHLISIGVTADRMPGMSQILSALLGIISEGFEDAHYFFGHGDHDHHHDHHHHHDHEAHPHLLAAHEDPNAHFHTLLEARLGVGHGHSHDLDLPTRVLKFIFCPVYLAAALWDWGFSNLSFRQALGKQWGDKQEQQIDLNAVEAKPSLDWQKTQTRGLIQKRKQQLNETIVGHDIALEKVAELSQLETAIQDLPDSRTINAKLVEESDKRVYRKTRFFGACTNKTETQELIETLRELNPIPAVAAA